MVTPSKAQEEEALHSKHITVGEDEGERNRGRERGREKKRRRRKRRRFAVFLRSEEPSSKASDEMREMRERLRRKKNSPPPFSPLPPPPTSSGRWVQYSSGRITRTGKVTQVLKTEEETPHPPKVSPPPRFFCVFSFLLRLFSFSVFFFLKTFLPSHLSLSPPLQVVYVCERKSIICFLF